MQSYPLLWFRSDDSGGFIDLQSQLKAKGLAFIGGVVPRVDRAFMIEYVSMNQLNVVQLPASQIVVDLHRFGLL